MYKEEAMPVEIMMMTGEREGEDKNFRKIEEAVGENLQLFYF
jgi:hypothetical protein